MQVFATDGKQGKLSHEFFVFRAAMLGVNKVEPLDIRRILDDSAQFALVRRRFLIAHIHPNIILAQLFVYDTPYSSPPLLLSQRTMCGWCFFSVPITNGRVTVLSPALNPYIREGLLFPADELRYYNGMLPDGEPDRIMAVVDTA